jgi:hypothetical protein
MTFRSFMSNTNPRVQSDNYDPHLVPAETAARHDREGKAYKQTPEKSEGDVDTSSGYTVDQEGLVNNYAIEPEMYINEPGDLQAEKAQEEAARVEEMRAANETDEAGKLTLEEDDRSKGVGLI